MTGTNPPTHTQQQVYRFSKKCTTSPFFEQTHVQLAELVRLAVGGREVHGVPLLAVGPAGVGTGLGVGRGLLA